VRVAVAEEVFKSDIPLPIVAQMQTRAARADRAGVDLRRLVAGFPRMAPDVAVVGEVRDREGLPEPRAHVDTAAHLGRETATPTDCVRRDYRARWDLSSDCSWQPCAEHATSSS
jgi:hypothetical protein